MQTASCGELSWDSSDLPSPYYIDANGSDDLSLSEVEAAVAGGWSAWEEPCCSDWSASYQGTVSGSALDSSDTRNIISFEESDWPETLGDGQSVLAVTLVMWTGDCRIQSADMLFNGADHTWAIGSGGMDLQSVATHEQGHWIGLDHSSVLDATMYASYSGGTAPRTLHSDDEAGVCYLYPGTCDCITADDCADSDEDCIDSVCQVPPCSVDADCEPGLVCDGGDCIVPTCTVDADCPDGHVCDDGTCLLDVDCAICLTCQTANDCGGAPYVCTSFGRCTTICGSTRDCPGDSVCFSVGGDLSYCLNPDAPTEVCASDYTCTDNCGGVTCPDGELCDPLTGTCECAVCDTCSTDADCLGEPCLCWGEDCYCTPFCDGSADCPTGSDCTTLNLMSGSSLDVCLNDNYDEEGPCPGDFVCGVPADPCAGVSCAYDEVCDPLTGECEPTVAEPDGTPDTGVADMGEDVDAGAPDMGEDADAGVPDVGEDVDAGLDVQDEQSDSGQSDNLPDIWDGGEDAELDTSTQDVIDAGTEESPDVAGGESDAADEEVEDDFPDASSGASFPEPDTGMPDASPHPSTAGGDVADAGADAGTWNPPSTSGAPSQPVPAFCNVASSQPTHWPAFVVFALLLAVLRRAIYRSHRA